MLGKRLRGVLAAIVLVSIMAAGCSDSSVVKDGVTGATVSADVYSGRVNPSWALSTSESGKLIAVIDSLKRNAAPLASALRPNRISGLLDTRLRG